MDYMNLEFKAKKSFRSILKAIYVRWNFRP
jgi:hypothetical protein